jgi:hypothetical protein
MDYIGKNFADNPFLPIIAVGIIDEYCSIFRRKTLTLRGDLLLGTF